MIEIKAHCSGIELFPTDNQAYGSLKRILSGIEGFNYVFRVDDPNANQGQMTSDFDQRIEQAILSQGASTHRFDLPTAIAQQLDFAFCYNDDIVAVEVEKTNREKILRDILKAHMYLYSGADYALLALPKNYPHSRGVWNLYEFGVKRLSECKTFGFGTYDKLDRILLLGFEQLDAETNRPLDTAWRTKIRRIAKGTKE